MKILFGIIAILLLPSLIFAYDLNNDGSQAAFNDTMKLLKNIFSQNAVQNGKDGINITCTIMPYEQMTALAWEIRNPGNKLLTIKPEDIRLYNDDEQFEQINTKNAIYLYYKDPMYQSTFDQTAESFAGVHAMPGEDDEEEYFYKSEFKFGNLDNNVINGIVYFDCRMKDLKSITAEIKIDGQSHKFRFDGGGP